MNWVTRWSALALVIAGVSNAIFWLLAAGIGGFERTAALHDWWVPSQLLHVIAALAALLGFLGLHAYQRRPLGPWGDGAFALLVVGLVAYACDGVIGLAVYPPIARSAPEFLAPGGALGSGLPALAFIAFASLGMTGGLAYAAVSYVADVLPRPAWAFLAIGSVLMNLPVGTVPFGLLTIGGVVWGASLVWLGAYQMVGRSSLGRSIAVPSRSNASKNSGRLPSGPTTR